MCFMPGMAAEPPRRGEVIGPLVLALLVAGIFAAVIYALTPERPAPRPDPWECVAWEQRTVTTYPNTALMALGGWALPLAVMPSTQTVDVCVAKELRR